MAGPGSKLPGSKPPGWYPDPDILPGPRGVLRYWNGRHWTERRRQAPILTGLDLRTPFGLPEPRALEGPVRSADVPAPAAEVSASREGPGGRSDTLDRLPGGSADVRGVERPAVAGGGRGIPPQLPETGGSGGGGGDDNGSGPGRGAKTGKRRKWWLIAGLAVVAALATILAGEAMRPPSVGPRVLTDSHFVQLANKDCAQTMPTLRPADGGQLGSVVTPVQAAAQINKASVGLDDLANQLAALPAAAPDQPHIAAWLAGWHRYADYGRQYASLLVTQGATNKPPAVLNQSAAVARTVDNFSRANGLSACLFAFTYVADPSQF